MERLVQKIIRLNFEEIQFFDFPKNELVGLIVNYHDGVKYEFLLNLKNDDKLLVIGSGLRGEQSKIDAKRPVFHRWSWKFQQSTLFYNDPTSYIHHDMEGGWGVGTLDNYYLKNISLIIKEISNNIFVDNKDIIFYGSSQGGFMSLVLSVFFKNSIAIAEVPQFDLSLFTERHWENLKKYCFNGLSEDEIKKNYASRIDIIELIKEENYIPNAYLILDTSFNWELSSAIIPFFERLIELPYAEYQNHFKIRLDGKNKGHSAQSEKDLLETIENIIFLENKHLTEDDVQTIFKKYLTLRMDIKNYGNERNSIEITDISDKSSLIEFPGWLKDNKGEGFKIESLKCVLDLKLKCVNDGELVIKLRGIDYSREGRIPIFINLYKFAINNEIIIDKDTLLSHDNFYTYKKSINDGDEVILSIMWEPV